MITRRHFIGFLAATPLAASPAFVDGPHIFSAAGYAIRGTDPVAYFREGRPVSGSDTNQLLWYNANWRFASFQNMAMFERDPYGFAPQYGGYCAMTLSQGNVSETIPEAWAIHEGKLYLTHSIAARDLWQLDPVSYIAKADANWPEALCR